MWEGSLAAALLFMPEHHPSLLWKRWSGGREIGECGQAVGKRQLGPRGCPHGP